jgi:2-isopropylmalate synthase
MYKDFDPNVVRIFDTTLRDGEQSPGATLNSAEKLEIARQLARLGVDIIEAGFPAASPDDLAAVQRIAREVGTADGPTIAGLARAKEHDIRTCWEGVKFAAKPRIHTFLGTSDIHLKYQTGLSRSEALDVVRKMVTLARSLCEDVEFSPMDAGRTDPGFLVEVCATAIDYGATTINVPDTVGYTIPAEHGAMFEMLIAETPGGGAGSGIIWSAHCHNDLGLATANTLAAISAGARQVEVTINGIGERAGNTSLEEVVMAIETRKPYYSLRTNTNTREIMKTSRMVSNYTGLVVQANKAIVGKNAFAHEAGIHQDGMIKNASTYEIMRPEDVGVDRSKLVLGKHSGRNALKKRLHELGYPVEGEALNQVFDRFKVLADAKKNVTDADLQALMTDEGARPQEFFKLIDMQVVCGTMGMPTATIKLANAKGEQVIHAAVGVGPVDACFRAVDGIINAPATLVEYAVHAVTEGIDALGEVTVSIAPPGSERSFGGYGADSDIVVSSVRAYISALNRMIATLGHDDVQPEGDAAAVSIGD